MDKSWLTQLRIRRSIRNQENQQQLQRRSVDGSDLQAALERHRMWIGSGWELGKRADLHRADLHGSDLKEVMLPEADLHAADLHRADLRDADLEGADLHRADLCRAKLHGAELRWADLHRARMCRADLEGADLKEADLHRADLSGANLRGADLRGADLRGADLRRAKGLTQAQIDAACGDPSTRLPHGLKPAEAGTPSGDEQGSC